MEKKTKTIVEIVTILGLLIGSYFIGRNSKSEPVKMQITQPIDTTRAI